MTERNPYSPYSYDTFDQRKDGGGPRGPGRLRSRALSRISNPVFATVALLLTGAAFAGIIIASYPDNSGPPQPMPVIKADVGDIRMAPDDGADDLRQSSSVFSTAQSSALEEKPPVENLLDQEEPMSELEAFAKEAESTYEGGASAAIAAAPAPAEITEAPAAAQPDETPAAAEAAPPAPEAKPAITAAAPTKAGSAPDTIAFVKSVLEEKDGKLAANIEPGTEMTINTQDDAAQSDVQKIEPAAGAATPAIKPAVVPGEYYIQLASVGSETGAPKEWGKLQKEFPSTLGPMRYRVQSAQIAGKGTMYRIQAGPLKKDDALNACAIIKVGKPGGCIIVQ